MKPHKFILLALTLIFLSCSRKPDMTQSHVILAEKFAHALVDGRFDDAHDFFTIDQKKLLPVAALKKDYEDMISYGTGGEKHVEVMQTLDDWPDKKNDDVGWVYVAILGDDFSEAVSVVVKKGASGLAIRSIELGRP
jgi:hypothetical protein